MGFGRWLFVVVAAAAGACAAKPPVLPSGPGTPYQDFARAYDEATASCRGVKTITVSMGLSGRAGSTKLRGRIDAGFAEPARARLEGIPPFGKPVFILVADAARGTLVLTREDRVLAGAPPDQIVEALAGVAIGPDALRTIVAGCGFPDGAPTAGSLLHASGNDWVVLTFPSSAGYLIRQKGAWRLAAAARGPLTVHYATDDRGRLASIRMTAVSAGQQTADILLTLSDVATNSTLDPRTFEVEVPPAAVPLTLDELRRAGPLGGSR
jgi:outer membrane lipoprotein-sorting protein